jgi:hypothetical protein
MNLCPLCNLKNADKKNSHIIPKFLGKPLFVKTGPRYTLQIDQTGRNKKKQDIPKQDFLICIECENRIAILETYFSKKFITINDYINRKDKFEIIESGPNKILKCLDFSPALYNLFWYSIIWRLSITSSHMFRNFKLPKKIELELGSYLNKNLQLTHKELLKNLCQLTSFPKFNLTGIKPIKKDRTFTGILTAFPLSKTHYGIFTSDIIVYFYLEKNDTKNKEVNILLANANQWKELSSSVLRLLNKNNQH